MNLKQQIQKSNLADFSKKVYLTLLKIPKGKVTTYKAVAKSIGTNAYRAVGGVIAKNPYIPRVPCHRVIASNGKLQGYMYGLKKKAQLLESEGIIITKNKVDKNQILNKI